MPRLVAANGCARFTDDALLARDLFKQAKAANDPERRDQLSRQALVLATKAECDSPPGEACDG